MRGTGYCMGEEVLGCVNWRISGGSGGQELCVDGSRVSKEEWLGSGHVEVD